MSFKDFFSLFLVLVAIVFCGDGTILAMLVQGHGRNISVMLLLLLLFIYLFFLNRSIDLRGVVILSFILLFLALVSILFSRVEHFLIEILLQRHERNICVKVF